MCDSDSSGVSCFFGISTWLRESMQWVASCCRFATESTMGSPSPPHGCAFRVRRWNAKQRVDSSAREKRRRSLDPDHGVLIQFELETPQYSGGKFPTRHMHQLNVWRNVTPIRCAICKSMRFCASCLTSCESKGHTEVPRRSRRALHQDR